MSTELLISIFGATTAIVVSIIGAFLTKQNNIIFQIRKLKEEHYTTFIEALHNHAAENSNETQKKLVLSRDKMLLIAHENVINRMLEYEGFGVGKSSELHDKYLTELIKVIRKDLKIKDKNFPLVGFKKSTFN